jgi:ABC-type antimicrobial peptide transport system permease subunit
MVGDGVVVGTGGTFYLWQVLRALLFGIEPGNPATLVLVAMLFLAVAAAASYDPARRATRVDPAVALRAE